MDVNKMLDDAWEAGTKRDMFKETIECLDELVVSIRGAQSIMRRMAVDEALDLSLLRDSEHAILFDQCIVSGQHDLRLAFATLYEWYGQQVRARGGDAKL